MRFVKLGIKQLLIRIKCYDDQVTNSRCLGYGINYVRGNIPTLCALKVTKLIHRNAMVTKKCYVYEKSLL